MGFMTRKTAIFSVIFFTAALSTSAQQAPQQNVDPTMSMAYDMNRIAISVQSMTKTLKDFVDKFAKAEGISINEKQARLVVGMQILVQAEQRVATLQNFQIELVEKEGQLRARLAQIENDLNPQSIDRSVAFEGSTQTPEIKENKRRGLNAERISLQGVLNQIQSNLQTASNDVREAQGLVTRLRRTYLPQVEKDLAEMWQ
jgi:hypothetical protein